MTWYLVNVQVSMQMVPLVCLTCEKTSVVLEGWESGGGMYFINNCDYTNIFIEWDLFPEITFDLCIPAFPLLNQGTVRVQENKSQNAITLEKN